MAGQTYQVNYLLHVDATQATGALGNFQKAVGQLMGVEASLNDIASKLNMLGGKTHTINIKIGGSSANYINTKAAALERLNRAILASPQQKAASLSTRVAGTSRTGSSGKSGSYVASSARTGTSLTIPRTRSGIPKVRTDNALGYKLLGPTPLPNNGGMAIDMLKGMGIAFGIAGLGSLIGKIVTQSSEYDNIMTTVKNILKSHDVEPDFAGRFANMSQVIRNVGMETKYTATEVASAAKFLAMAGMNVSEIKSAIRPIADIALVGDTDLGTTADLVTNIMKSYNIQGSKMRQAADVMTNTFTMTNTTLTEIAESYKYAGTPLAMAGVDFAEATAAIGILGDAGRKGTLAGTDLRMIMNNILNPTKKQRQAWNALGVKTTDASGKTKGLMDIFQELHDKNASINDLYKMFRTTAVPGAGALMNNVEKWKNVTFENTMSNGLSARLADAKKNTLQGLWAQLTSVFTDQGIKAFENNQGGLRSLMQRAVEWLKTDNAAQKFHAVAKAMFEFIDLLKQAAKWFMYLYEKMAPFVKVWFKFQLLIWPVVKAFQALKTVWLSLTALKTTVITVRAFTAALLGLRSAQLGVAASSAQMGATASGSLMMRANAIPLGAAGYYGMTGIMPMMPGLTHREYRNLLRGTSIKTLRHWNPFSKAFWKDNSLVPWQVQNPINESHLKRPHAIRRPASSSPEALAQYDKIDKENLQNYKNAKKAYSRRVALSKMGHGVASAGGMMLGGFNSYKAMQQMTDKEGSKWAAGLYGIGAVASMFGPWGMAIGGLLTGVGYLTEYFHKQGLAKDAARQINDMMSQYTIKDGMVVKQHAKGTEQYLQMIFDKNKDIVSVLDMRIAKAKEAAGIEDGGGSNAQSGSNDLFAHYWQEGERGGISANAVIQAANKFQEVTGVYILKNGNQAAVSYKDKEGKPHTVDINPQQALGVASMVLEGVDGASTLEAQNSWFQNVGKAYMLNLPDGQTKLAQKLQEVYGDYDEGEMFSKMPKVAAGYKKMAEDTQLLWAQPFIQMVRYRTLASRYGTNNPVIQAENAFREAQRADSTNLWNAWVAFNRFGPEDQVLGMSKNWLKKEIGYDGSKFVDKFGNIMSDGDLLARYNLAVSTRAQMKKQGLDSSKQPNVLENIKNLDFAIRQMQGYLAFTEIGKDNKVTLPDNWQFPDGAVIAVKGQYLQYDAASDSWDYWIKTKSSNPLDSIADNSFEQDEERGINFFGGFKSTFEDRPNASELLGTVSSNTESTNVAGNTSDSFYEFGRSSTLRYFDGLNAALEGNSNWYDLFVLGKVAPSEDSSTNETVSDSFWSFGRQCSLRFFGGFKSTFEDRPNAFAGENGEGASNPLLEALKSVENNNWLPQIKLLGESFGANAAVDYFTSALTSFQNATAPIANQSEGTNSGYGKMLGWGTGTATDAKGKANEVNGPRLPMSPLKPGFKPTPLSTDKDADKNPKSGKSGVNPGDYKSKYKSSAAPKQININIKSLLNVDKLDLTGPEKEAVVTRLKEEIAYALYEAASDGANMLNYHVG